LERFALFAGFFLVFFAFFALAILFLGLFDVAAERKRKGSR